jgi:HAD superfamily hydrolase (TIGR01484 family)
MVIASGNTFENVWSPMVKIEALFSDYDGTLCPLEVRREDAVIAPRLRRLLTKASKNVKIGIVTTKDLAFIEDRVPFAHGIAATCGLEMRVGDRTIVDDRVKEPDQNVQKTYQEILGKVLQIRDNIMIERKETEDGELMAFCIDWRLSRDWPEAHRKTLPLLSVCRERGLYVVESEISPFANVYPMEVEKGTALTRLKTELGMSGPVIYMGDSEADNSAFRIADVSVGVKHRRIMPKLECKYRLEFFELENFLSNLTNSNFEFQDQMLEKNPG